MADYIRLNKKDHNCPHKWYGAWTRLVNGALAVAGKPDIVQELGTYAIDTHVHTLFSRCSVSQPMDILLKAQKIGLSGICIMDHNNPEGSKNTADCAEYLKEKGLLHEDFIVVPGQEISTADGHVGVMFSLDNYPINEPAEVLEKRVHDNGGLVVAVHPLHSAGIKEKLLDIKVDVVEIDCGAVFDKSAAQVLRKYLAENKVKYLAEVGSSDGHYVNATGMCYTLVKDEKPSLEGFRQALLSGKTKSVNTKAYRKFRQFLNKVKQLK